MSITSPHHTVRLTWSETHHAFTAVAQNKPGWEAPKGLDASAVLLLELRTQALDASNAQAFLQTVMSLIAHQSKVVLDLAEVRFMDGQGLAALIVFNTTLKKLNAQLHLCELTHTVSKLFELARLNRTLKTHARCFDAVHHCEC